MIWNVKFTVKYNGIYLCEIVIDLIIFRDAYRRGAPPPP